MSLLENEALEIAKNPTNSLEVQKGRKYESWLRILTISYNKDDVKHESAWRELDNYLMNILTSDKYNQVSKMFTYPMAVVNISNDIVTDIYTVFNGRNASFDIKYPPNNRRFKQAASETFEFLNIRHWIEQQGKEVLKNKPNSITVVDIDENGDPVLILVDNDRLLGYEFNKDGTFKYVVFVHSKGKDWKRVALYDDEYYRVYFVKDGNYTLESQNPHSAGYCPARFFYDKPLEDNLRFDRSVVLSNVIGTLTQWQLMHEFIYYADHYCSFPAVEIPAVECDCNNGYIDPKPIIDENNGEKIGMTEREKCDNCASKGLLGPGTAFEVYVSEDPDMQDIRNVLRFVSPDVKNLEYARQQNLSREVFAKENTVGYSNVTTKEAVNAQQIKYLSESRSKMPREISFHLSNLYKWIVKTTALLIYESDLPVNASFGTEFLVIDETDVMMLIQEAKKAGVQSSVIADLNKQLIETKYKTQPNKVAFMSIAADLEPSPFDTREEVLKKFENGMITRDDYYLKLNFYDLISRFERENGSIVEWGMELSYDEKIKRIKNTLNFYVNQKIETNEESDTEPTEAGATGASDI